MSRTAWRREGRTRRIHAPPSAPPPPGSHRRRGTLCPMQRSLSSLSTSGSGHDGAGTSRTALHSLHFFHSDLPGEKGEESEGPFEKSQASPRPGPGEESEESESSTGQRVSRRQRRPGRRWGRGRGAGFAARGLETRGCNGIRGMCRSAVDAAGTSEPEHSGLARAQGAQTTGTTSGICEKPRALHFRLRVCVCACGRPGPRGSQRLGGLTRTCRSVPGIGGEPTGAGGTSHAIS
jgi:hypothetical protein